MNRKEKYVLEEAADHHFAYQQSLILKKYGNTNNSVKITFTIRGCNFCRY